MVTLSRNSDIISSEVTTKSRCIQITETSPILRRHKNSADDNYGTPNTSRSWTTSPSTGKDRRVAELTPSADDSTCTRAKSRRRRSSSIQHRRTLVTTNNHLHQTAITTTVPGQPKGRNGSSNKSPAMKSGDSSLEELTG